MKEKNTTIDDLAQMVAKGFEKTATKDELKEGLNFLRSDMNDGFSEVNRRLDNIEHLIAEEHRIRIERLEENVNTLMNAVGLSK